MKTNKDDKYEIVKFYAKDQVQNLGLTLNNSLSIK